MIIEQIVAISDFYQETCLANAGEEIANREHSMYS